MNERKKHMNGRINKQTTLSVNQSIDRSINQSIIVIEFPAFNTALTTVSHSLDYCKSVESDIMTDLNLSNVLCQRVTIGADHWLHAVHLVANLIQVAFQVVQLSANLSHNISTPLTYIATMRAEENKRFHIYSQVNCMGAHSLYRSLNRRGLLDPIKVPHDARCQKTSS